MLKKTRLSIAVGAALSAGIAGFAPTSFAQTTQPQQMDRVEVTGSLIRRSQAETALPVTTINMDDLTRVGVTTAEQAMTFITENQSMTGASQSVGATNGAASYVDLRALGPERTLVLLNGQRVVNNPYSGIAVDLNTIPMVAVERIEVLRDGASAIYGSDAIAGVVNIITRKEYQGVAVNASGAWPDASGGGESYSAGISGGFGSLAQQGFNVWGGFTYNRQEQLMAVDRPALSTGINEDKGMFKTSGTSFPGNANNGNPSYPNCQPPRSLAFPDLFGPNTCRYDYTQQIDLIPYTETWSFMGRGTLALGANNQVFLEYFRTYNENEALVAPTPLTGLAISATNPYNTIGATSVGWRMEPAGQRGSRMENTTDRWLAGLEGAAGGWNYAVNALYSASELSNIFTDGYVSRTTIQNGLNGNAPIWLNPFGPQGAGGDSYITGAKVLGEVQNIEGKTWGINGNVQREVFSMAGGPAILAMGAEFRKEEVEYNNNFALIRQAASSGLELAEDAEGDRDVWAVMAELNIPVLKDLEFSVAVRYDDYSDVGSKVTPKVGVRYQALNNLLLRASYNQGFRAPSLYDVYAPNSITFTADSWDDPVLCPGGVVNTAAGGISSRDCAQQFQSQQGGNEALEPEESDSWTVGFVWDATRNVSFSLDYWQTEVQGYVGVISESSIFTDPTKYANLYVRCSQLTPTQLAALSGTCFGTGDPLAYVVQTQQNLGDMKVNGIDLSLQLRSDATPYGRFTLGLQGTYLTKWEQQLEKGGEFYSSLGIYSHENNFPAPRYKQVVQVGWSYDAWSANLANRFTSGYWDQNLTEFGGDYDFNKVGKYSLWDLTGTWQGVKGLTITAGVLNLFDEDPPFSNQGATFQVQYDPRLASPIGRQWVARIGYEFK